MDQAQLEAFVAVIDVGSFTRAAARLGVAQPTVTNRVKALEQAFGAVLLERRTTGIVPTDAGSELLPYAREILRLARRARQAVLSRGEPRGRVDIGCLESLINHRLMPFIEYLYVRYPKIQLSLHSSTSDEAVTHVRSGHFDCAFFLDAEHAYDDLDVQVLCPEPLVLVAAAGHTLLEQARVTTADLLATTLVCSDTHAKYYSRLAGIVGGDDQAAGQRTLELDSVDAAKRSVANGLGVALLPEVAVVDEIESGVLARVPWKSPVSTFTQVASRRNRELHPALRVVIAVAEKVIQEQLDGD